jgi:hypothetical protein
VPLVAAAVCPHPPLLVPEIASGAAGELDDLRSACDSAVGRLLAAGPQALVVLGSGPQGGRRPVTVGGSFAPWGVPLTVQLGRQCPVPGGDPQLPLSLLVGAWLLNRSGPPELTYDLVAVGSAEPVERCASAGARMDGDRPWALLVMGDGSACRGEDAPGYDDPRATPYDDAVAAALADADAAALLGLDPVVSAQLKATGRAPWQVLAGAVRASGRDWRGDLNYDAAPYGVAYFVASWEPT